MKKATVKRMRGSERRILMLDDAMKIVCQDGVPALTLATLAERSGVSKPIAYNHFKSRENLLRELYLRVGAEHEETAQLAIASLLDDQCDKPCAARVVAAALLDCIVQNGSLFTELMAGLRSSPDGAQMASDIRANILAGYAEALEGFGGGPVSSALLASALLGAAETLGDAVARDASYTEEAIALLVRLIGAQP